MKSKKIKTARRTKRRRVARLDLSKDAPKSFAGDLRINFDLTDIDMRTSVGKAMKTIRAALDEWVGPNPLARALVDRVLYKMIRLSLFESHYLLEPDPDIVGQSAYLTMSNSLRQDLAKLNEISEAKGPMPDFDDYLKDIGVIHD